MAFLRIVLFASFVGVALAGEWDCSTTSGTFTLSSDCVVSSQVEVTGILSLTGVVNASGVLPRVIGGGSNRLFYVGSGGNLTIRSLNLTGGNATLHGIGDNLYKNGGGGAVGVYSGNFAAIDSVMTGNKATYGGALYERNGQVVLKHTNIIANTATLNGGGIVVHEASLKMIGVRVIGNNVLGGWHAPYGGGVTCTLRSICDFEDTLVQENNARFGAGISTLSQGG